LAKWTKTRPVYVDRGWYPTPIVFIPSPEAYEKFHKNHPAVRKEFAKHAFTYPTARGHTTFIDSREGNSYILVFLGPWADTAHPVEVMGVITHEVQHVLQYLWQDIGESTRGQEQEAYAAQQLFGQLVQCFMLTRRPKWPFKVTDLRR
jgi:hypothetical protein